MAGPIFSYALGAHYAGVFVVRYTVLKQKTVTHTLKLKPTAEKNVLIKSSLLKNISFKSFGEE